MCTLQLNIFNCCRDQSHKDSVHRNTCRERQDNRSRQTEKRDRQQSVLEVFSKVMLQSEPKQFTEGQHQLPPNIGFQFRHYLSGDKSALNPSVRSSHNPILHPPPSPPRTLSHYRPSPSTSSFPPPKHTPLPPPTRSLGVKCQSRSIYCRLMVQASGLRRKMAPAMTAAGPERQASPGHHRHDDVTMRREAISCRGIRPCNAPLLAPESSLCSGVRVHSSETHRWGNR